MTSWFACWSWPRLLDFFDLNGTRSFLAFTNFELHGISFLQEVSIRFRMMNEQIVAALILYNESVALLVVEPLYLSCSHLIAFCFLLLFPLRKLRMSPLGVFVCFRSRFKFLGTF